MSQTLRIALLCGLALFSMAGLSNCKSTIGTGAFMATQDFSDKKLTQLSDKKVEGKGCRQHIFFVPVGEQSFNAAFQDALSKSPEGTTGLMHAEMSTSVPLFGGLVFGRYCQILKGFPAKAETGS